jgi:hypothetical protein
VTVEPRGPVPDESEEETVTRIVEEMRDEIVHGNFEGDTGHVLDERLAECGVSVRPERLDDLADEIESGAST